MEVLDKLDAIINHHGDLEARLAAMKKVSKPGDTSSQDNRVEKRKRLVKRSLSVC